MPPTPDRLATLRAWDKAHLWHPFTPQADWAAADPLVVERGEGVYLFDIDGNKYLDGSGSLWCNVHGHRHPALDAAIRSQLDKLAHSTLLGLTHEPAILLARRLAELAPAGLSRVFFSADGASAVEAALKMALQYWHQRPDPQPGRRRFVALGNAYHGDTVGAVSLGDIGRFHAIFSPLLFDALRAPSPYCYRCPLGLQRPGCEIACLGELEKILADHAGEVIAVIVEPIVQGAGGMIAMPEGYLRGVRELTRKYDTLMIADEVAVGFGKTGTLFAVEQENVLPDILCLAKGLTGGYLPMSATLATEEIYSAFFATAAEGGTFQHGHTYGGNPLSAAVALASLRVFEEERTLQTMVPKVEALRGRLEGLWRHPHVGDVRQRGLIAGIELVADKTTKTPFDAASTVGARVCRAARARGVIVRPLGDIVVLMPPLAIDESQIHALIDAVEYGISEVCDPK